MTMENENVSNVYDRMIHHSISRIYEYGYIYMSGYDYNIDEWNDNNNINNNDVEQ